ncbi:complement C1q and tumor necrosis factor-related protein 9A-like [Puntigrus tetrazona]|uniref:complement C1q and tumor necrosis factor-related protein 9A-like n=1 Tax=Puntigrus tetrazona TaxID=1606681 RepID=UPI001C8A5410|nr:complement C1q and tumor necrosis factor-related protein 9A-like [Puntigrus tetrazona]
MILFGREFLVPPSPGSPDSPIPPDDYFEGSAARNDYIPIYAYDNYPIGKAANPMARGGPLMPYNDELKGYPLPMFPVLPDLYPILLKPLSGNTTQGSRTVPTGQQPDLSYCNVLLEAPVPPPMDQMPWFCVCLQCKGGPNSSKGNKGDLGLPGQIGDIGEKGHLGAFGLKGLKGEQGPKGDKGDRGLDGNQGQQGLPGETGQCPVICYSIKGSQGELGHPGMAGGRGVTGLRGSHGSKGQKGDLGDDGPQGAPGLNGQKGDQGERGECHCSDGRDGANGIIGISGLKGSNGETGHQGAIGLNGEKGQKGDLGVMGAPGPCSSAIQSIFLAALSSKYPQPDLPVPFTDVFSNRGFNFDSIRGVYRAPLSGTYVISYNLVGFNKLLKVGLFHNFRPVIKNTGPVVLAISQQVVLHLIMGDEVWLQVKDVDSNGMYFNSESSSTFSGFLLYPDSCDMPTSGDFQYPISGTYSWGY